MIVTTQTAAVSRRNLIQGGAVTLAALASSQPMRAGEVPTIPLWPGQPPGGLASPLTTAVEHRSTDTNVYTSIAAPWLTVYRPIEPNGTALVMAQGGGYTHIANGAKVPAYFTAQGITVFDLIYRLPSDGWTVGAEAPKQDGQRAIRLVRKLAPQYGLDPHRIGVIGFSAGGHVAGTAATTFAQKAYAAVDDADGLSARPDFAILSCPVITMLDPFAHKGSRKLLIGDNSAKQEAYSLERQVTADTPPIFLVHANDDKVVPADNSMLMALALRRAAVPVELHLYREGGHGMGPNLAAELPASHWPDAMLAWLSHLALPVKA